MLALHSAPGQWKGPVSAALKQEMTQNRGPGSMRSDFLHHQAQILLGENKMSAHTSRVLQG